MGHELNENATKIEINNLQCVDLSNPDIHQSAAQIKQAFMDSGIFYLINHGVSNQLRDEAFAENKKFFEVPMDEKMKLYREKYNYGRYLPPPPEYNVESYTQGAGELAEDPKNVWPPEDIFPRWKATMGRFQQEIFNVGKAVARLIALALDVDIDFFNQPELLGADTASICNILHYKVQETDKEAFGVVHTDFSLFTFVAIDDVLGLQICRDPHVKPQSWEYVLPLKGAFLVHVGDVLERLSNGNFRSILHNVAYRQDRHSVSLFFLPSYDYVIECLPNQTSEENPPKYSPIKFLDFWNARYEAAGRSD